MLSSYSGGDLAIITARGGSKRIPGKNMKEFCGKPIIAYSIEAALRSGLFSEVMVSTDDEGIAKLSRSLGANVPFLRSAKTSDDFATTSDVLSEVISCYEGQGEHHRIFCCIYPTAPFVTSSLLRRARAILDSDEAVDSVVPIVKYSFPPQRAFIHNGKFIRFSTPEYSQMRSQDLKPIYHDCGQFYYCRTESFKKYVNMVMPRTVGLERDEALCQDIDNPSDWEIAELKYSLAVKKGLIDV